MNHDPDKVEHSFYPAYVPVKHDYPLTNADDILKDQAITVALDYQWRIVPLVAAQIGKLPGKEYNTTNIIAGVHSLYEALIRKVPLAPVFGQVSKVFICTPYGR